MAAHRNIRIDLNADYELSVRWRPASIAGVQQDPHLLSDAEMQVRLTEDASTPLITASVDNGFITLDSELNGAWANIVIPKATLELVTYYGVASYDIVVTRDSDSRIKRLLDGSAVLSQGTTR